jgi:hypothetical protein
MSGRRILGCALAVLCAVCAAPLLAGSISAAARPAPGRESLRSGRLSAADAESLTAARERLIGNCMRRHSLGYLPFRQDDFTDQLFPLVLTSVRWARKYGFGGGASAVLPDPNGPRAARLSGSRRELYYQALDGRPAGPSFQVRMPGGSVLAESASGCHTGAQRRLYGSAADWFGAHALASVARGTVIGEVERAGRFQAAVTVWRWCMERRGLNYPSPQAAEENATTPGRILPRPRTAIAAAEAACASETPLARVSAALYGEEEKKLPGRLQDALRVERYLELNAVPRATLILSGKTQSDPG